MFTFQFQDGSFQIDRLTRFARPENTFGGLARSLFEGRYATRAGAEAAMEMIGGFGQ